MTRKPTAPLIEAADTLQDWDGIGQFGADEVLAWWGKDGRAKFALRGPALRIELRSLIDSMRDNRYCHLDISIQQAMGNKARPLMHGNRVVGVEGEIGQTMDYPEADISQVFDAISLSIQTFLEKRDVEVDVFTTLMPKEGSPWEWNQKQTYFYNAHRGIIESTKRPDWIIPVEARDRSTSQYVKTHGADFCKFAPVISADVDCPMVCRFEERDLDFMVTHSIDITRYDTGWRKIAKFINYCGGILFPSLAVGQVPGARFGPVCLVVNPMVVLEGMKPYARRQGQWPIITYSTDVWTETMGDFLGNASATLFEQLTGQWPIDLFGRMHFYILGPPLRLDGPMEGKPILNTKKLSTVLGRRARRWSRDLTGEEVEGLQFTEREDRYPYLEAKSNGIVSVEALVACAAPSSMMRSVKDFLDAIDFQGEVIPIRTSREEANALSVGLDYGLLYDYSWRVFDAVIGRAYEQRRIERVVLSS